MRDGPNGHFLNERAFGTWKPGGPFVEPRLSVEVAAT